MAGVLKNNEKNALVLMRILIGWHFLYEGISKLYNPNWTAKGYLLSSEGFLKSFFVWLASDSMIDAVNFLNMFGLTLVGLGLIIGFWERIAAYAGVIILLLYYLSHPAFPGLEQMGAEGNYWIVNKNLIEASALLVIAYLPTSGYFGVKRLFKGRTTTSSAL